MRADHGSTVPRQARPYQGRQAGLVTRVIAGVVDAVVVAVSLVAGYVGVNGIMFLLHPRTFRFSEVPLLLGGSAWLLLLVVYLGVAWSVTGRSCGGHVMGVRVVGQGRRLRPHVALTRAVLCAVFPIGLLWCAGDRAHRSLQDLVLRTAVVYDWRLGRSPR
jgi:hypothetical protein